jgi:hypothetical protein
LAERRAGQASAIAGGQLFDVAQQRPLGALAKRNRDTRGAGPRGAADPVNIGFRHFGKFEIDNMRDAVDVEAARRDVGCDEGADAAAAKRFKRTFPLALALVAVNRASRDPCRDRFACAGAASTRSLAAI